MPHGKKYYELKNEKNNLKRNLARGCPKRAQPGGDKDYTEDEKEAMRSQIAEIEQQMQVLHEVVYGKVVIMSSGHHLVTTWSPLSNHLVNIW